MGISDIIAIVFGVTTIMLSLAFLSQKRRHEKDSSLKADIKDLKADGNRQIDRLTDDIREIRGDLKDIQGDINELRREQFKGITSFFAEKKEK